MVKLNKFVIGLLLFLVVLFWLFAPQGSTGLLLFFLLGVLLFYWGFRTFRELRILEDTPVMHVRSLAMGLAHIRGKTTGDDRITSPLTQQPCFHYSLRVERYVKAGDDSGWKTVRDDRDERKFYLDDGTAKVLVDPASAEYDVLQTFSGEFGSRSKSKRLVDPSLNMAIPSEQDLRAFVQDRLARARASLTAPNPAGTAGQAPEAPKPKAFQISIGGGGAAFHYDGDQSYRVTEHCLLAGRECMILGTCVENPSPRDEHDRNLVKKGQNEKTFLITTKSERQEESALRRRAALLVLVGAGVMITAFVFAIYGGKK